ncbi:MAG: hypothetical protein M1824_005478 [Vezdaea acicularis]|nr:MAG: hypothetical protein M1824_005478 [Vezdaea acicularis]
MGSTSELAVSKDDLAIPLIDFSLFRQGALNEKVSVAKAVLDGFQTAGFIYLKNHGISSDCVRTVFKESSKFFARPEEQKDSLAWTTPESNRGYVAPGREKVTDLTDPNDVEALRAQAPDLKESMEIGKENEPGYPNHWPDKFDQEGEEFKRVMLDFFEECQALNMLVMRSIALGMGLDERYFDQYTDGADNTLRLLHYPPVGKTVFEKNKAQVRAGEHSDYGDSFQYHGLTAADADIGSITLLFQDDRGGLQVGTPRGTFVDATPIPGTVVVNAGDLLQRWSNDRIKSTKHRVVEPPIPPASGEYPARYSIAYFGNPNFDKFIDAIPGTYGSEGKKYPGVNSREYLVQRLAATY